MVGSSKVWRKNRSMKSLPFLPSPLILLLASALGLCAASTSTALEPVKIDVADDYYAGEAFQVRLAIPARAGGIRIFLQDPKGRLASLLPNDFEPLPEQQTRAFRWLIPQPTRGYEVLLHQPGQHRVLTLHARKADLEAVAWPDSLPLDEIPALIGLRSHLEAAGLAASPRDFVVSTLVFTVREGERPAAERLPLSSEGILDGLDTPRFTPGGTNLAANRDYRILWRWAALLRSPTHRHQKFLVECHSHGASSRKENLDLSEARARAIVDYLVENAGIPEERLSPSGKGNFEPLPDDGPLPPGANDRVVLALDNSAGVRTLLRP